MGANGGKTLLRAGSAQANGISIAYESYGSDDRKVVLFIAGTGMQLIDWPIDLVEALVEAGFRCIRYDNRDCGLTTKFSEAGSPDSEAITQALMKAEPVPTPYSLNDMAEDAVGLLDALGIPKAHLVGVSMGGAIAQLVAITYPDRVHSMVLIGADSGNSSIPVVAKPEAFAHIPPMPDGCNRDEFLVHQIETDKVLNSPGYPTSEAEIVARRKRSTERDFDPSALQRQQTVIFLDRFISPYRYENLHKIQTPTMVIHGLDDVLVPVEAAKDIARKIPGAKLVIIPGMGHGCPAALVDAFAQYIVENASRAR